MSLQVEAVRKKGCVVTSSEFDSCFLSAAQLDVFTTFVSSITFTSWHFESVETIETKTKKPVTQDHGSEKACPEVSQDPESSQWTLRADPHTLPGG